jgi:hypothetical protein
MAIELYCHCHVFTKRKVNKGTSITLDLDIEEQPFVIEGELLSLFVTLFT